MTRFHFGTSASTIPANVFSFSGVMSGKRTRFTFSRRISTDRSSRSTETPAEKKMTPNFVVLSSFFVTDTAARPVSVSPLKVSICGWYMTAVLPFGVVNSRGHGSGVISAPRAPPAPARSKSPRAILARFDLMKVLLFIQYASRRSDSQTSCRAGRRIDVIYDDILGTIGNTPVVRINKLAPAGTTIYVKCEAFNPMSSVKDRLAIAMIEDAERRGVLKPGQTVVEPTSGNTGIALAMVCAVKGYPFVAIMADSFSVERRKLMKGLGAKVILSPAANRASGMVKQAKELADKHGWFLPQQFENPSNPAYHRQTTGPEILLDFASRRLDYFVSGIGTGGTITGAGEVLKLARPDIKIIYTEPAGAPLVSKGEWAPHKIQGWLPDFIPAVFNRKIYDEAVLVTDMEARDAARELAHKEGIFCGISSGGTFAAARKVAEKAPKGSVLLAMLPDTGERYLSTILFEGVTEGSDEIPV